MNGYPNCIVSPFGSTVNGLGFRGCDVDIYLDLGQYAWRVSYRGAVLLYNLVQLIFVGCTFARRS